MWKCRNCETDNTTTDDLCNSCDGPRPAIDSLLSTLLTEGEAPVYTLSWSFLHTDRLEIDNGIGIRDPSGETELVISKPTVLKFIASNRYTEVEHVHMLAMPPPEIESFTSTSGVEIELGKPVHLQWKVRFASKINILKFGDFSGKEKADIDLTKSETIVLIVENESGTDTSSINFTLPEPVIKIFKADTKKKILQGEDILLKWSVKNAETLHLSGFGDFVPTETSKIIRLEKSGEVILTASNDSGSNTRSLKFDILPKPEIEHLTLSESVILRGDDVAFSWKANNFSKLILTVGSFTIDVTSRTEYKMSVFEDSSVTLTCESLEGLKSIHETKDLRVIERVTVDPLKASKMLVIQSLPVELTWVTKNAKEVILWPDGKSLSASGSIELRPSVKTRYIIEAKNELMTAKEEIEIDVHPLPSFDKISLKGTPMVKFPSFADYYLERSAKEPKPKGFFAWLKYVLKRKNNCSRTYTIRAGWIRIVQHNTYVEIGREISLTKLLSLLKSGKIK